VPNRALLTERGHTNPQITTKSCLQVAQIAPTSQNLSYTIMFSTITVGRLLIDDATDDVTDDVGADVCFTDVCFILARASVCTPDTSVVIPACTCV